MTKVVAIAAAADYPCRLQPFLNLTHFYSGKRQGVQLFKNSFPGGNSRIEKLFFKEFFEIFEQKLKVEFIFNV